MLRKIIEINEQLCNGCGACAQACHEDAIRMIDGKAKLMRDDYCDGLGDCLPVCPVDAIHFVERDTLAYDEAAVLKNKAEQQAPLACGCPGSHVKQFSPSLNEQVLQPVQSALQQWPVQIKLVPTQASYFKHAHLLIAADCSAFAYGDFHQRFMNHKVTLIGCPKLDLVDYSEKLCEILRQNDIQSVCVVRMEVPCCGGIEQAVKTALQASGKFIPWQVVTITCDGLIKE